MRNPKTGQRLKADLDSHLEAFLDVFVQVVRLAGEVGLVQWGNVSIDGTKLQGNASRHKAMSYGYRKKAVERVREEIEALGTQAAQQDEAESAALGSHRGDELPAELARRADRLGTIAAAMRRLEAQAQATAEAERQRRADAEAERQRRGTPRRGKGALWYSPGCKIIVLSTAYVNMSTFQHPEKRVQRCARPLRFHSTSPM